METQHKQQITANSMLEDAAFLVCICGQDLQKDSGMLQHFSFAFQLVLDPQAGNMGVLFPHLHERP